jgi:hypothetical protein
MEYESAVKAIDKARSVLLLTDALPTSGRERPRGVDLADGGLVAGELLVVRN